MQETDSKASILVSSVLTDVSIKSNKKITYTRRGSVVTIETQNIHSWNFLYKLSSLIKDIFLPRGYPDSVSSDYLEYQIWDTCQAFCSSISGTLAMRAVLQGIGVGSENATPVSAAITWLLKDGTGMIGSILFTWVKGSKLDSDCKKWRLFADILNDVAMFIELYVPYVLEYSMYMLCTATVFKAVVGTAGSSTRAALITHQAVKGNIADVSAKDGSQEICTNLLAFVFGIFLLKNVTDTQQIWTVMCTATVLHLLFNYKAVRCLKINVFNKQRFLICLRTYLPTSVVPTVEQINRKESVFLMQGISDYQVCGFSIVFGACLNKVMRTRELTGSLFSSIMALFYSKRYVILAHLRKKKLYVGFQQNITDADILKAYFHAILLGISLNYLQERKNLSVISRCRKNSPIYRLKNILKELFTEEGTETDANEKNIEILSHAYLVCEDFIEKEFTAFCYSCNDEDWVTDKQLFNLGDWRAEWRYGEKKELKFLMRDGKSRHSPRPSPSQQQQQQQRKMQVLLIS